MGKQVLIITGSIRTKSFNRQLAERIEGMLKDRADVMLLDYSDVPFINQDIEFPAPEPVKRVRDQIMAVDGVWIVTPEYNFSYPGILKNLLDWLSRPIKPNDYQGGTAIAGKKVTISGASGKSAAGGERNKLRELLTFIKADVMAEGETGVALDMDAFMTDCLQLSSESEQAIERQAEAFLSFIGA